MHPHRVSPNIVTPRQLTAVCITLFLAAHPLHAAQSSESESIAQSIFNSKCHMCHFFEANFIGPAFKNMSHDPQYLKNTITHGRGMMPAWKKKLSEQEIDAMVRFIRSKQTDQPQATH